jgi:hypothetical protein
MRKLDVLPLPPTIMEQWFLQMEEALSHRKLLHVQLMGDHTVIAITKYQSMGAFLAGRGIIDQIKAMISHMRAARAEPMEEAKAFEEARARIAETRELVSLLEAERIHGRSRLTDYLRVPCEL